MQENRKALIWLGVITIVTAVLITYLALVIGGISLSRRNHYKLYFANATGIPDNADVRIAGIKVGQVEQLELAPDARGALVQIGIDPAIPVYSDAQAVIKSKSLLGERFIELRPGSRPPILTSGAQITDTITPFRVEDLGELLGPMIEDLDPELLRDMTHRLVTFLTENQDEITATTRELVATVRILHRLLRDNEADVRVLLTTTNRTLRRLDRFFGRNETALDATLQGAATTVERIQTLLDRFAELGRSYPTLATDVEELLTRSNRLLTKLETTDAERLLLVLKSILQDEGITVNLFGYDREELQEQIRGYHETTTSSDR